MDKKFYEIHPFLEINGQEILWNPSIFWKQMYKKSYEIHPFLETNVQEILWKPFLETNVQEILNPSIFGNQWMRNLVRLHQQTELQEFPSLQIYMTANWSGYDNV
jgi:hypothetical protein